MAYFVADDNEHFISSECIATSKRIMKGHKWDYLMLSFSYMGWILLDVCTLGILSFWLLPRMNMASYLFYLDIRDNDYCF